MTNSDCDDPGSLVLELRIHGVNNTSPPAMLDLDPNAVERVAGDDLGGFWRAKRGALDCVEKPTRGWTPQGVVREAYSWGGLARTSPDGWGPGVLHTVMAAFGRIAWVLLIPFGLSNVSYWSRRLPLPADRVRSGRGAVGQRLFALFLTTLFVVTVCEVALDMVARQCFAKVNGKPEMLCSSLPSQLEVLKTWQTSQLLAAFSLVPVVFLLGLWWVTGSSGARYEQFVAEHQLLQRSTTSSGEPVLRRHGFWAGAHMLRGLLSLHLSTSVAVVTLFSSLPAVVGNHEKCQTVHQIVRSTDCSRAIKDGMSTVWPFAVVSVVALSLVVAGVARLAARSTDGHTLPSIAAMSARTWLDQLLLLIACLVLATELALLVVRQPAIAPLHGLTSAAAAPTLLAACLFGLVVASLVWRWPLPATGNAWLRRSLPTVLGLCTTVGLMSPIVGSPLSWVLAGLGLVAVVVAYVVPGPSDAGHRAWRGRAPAFFQAIGLMSAMTLSSLVVLTTGDWLNGGNTASSLIEQNPVTGTDPEIRVPAVYVWFGMLALGGLILVLASLLGFYVRNLARTPPGPAGPDAFSPMPGDDGAADADPELGADPVAGDLRRARRKARRFAAFAQRAELWVSFLVFIGSAAVATAVVSSALQRPLFADVRGHHVLAWAASWSTQAVVVVGLAGVAALVGGKAVGGVRPLGLVWDLICFLPRASHPLGPPCYAERAVPEITDRCLKWLATPVPELAGKNGGKKPGEQRRVVLSAHSLGSVLAVGVLLHFPTSLGQVSLLTYGSQLRAYFGRLFPELLGPDVLGNAPSPGPALTGPDPWHCQRDRTEPPNAPGEGWNTTLVDLLGASRSDKPAPGRVRWRNLWRRTDYLGFPVDTYQQLTPGTGAGLGIDHTAQEVDNTGYMLVIGSHSDYPRASAYDNVFQQLLKIGAPS